ncbi:MAG: hypothetical protein P8127_15880 [Acidobacteriota bacterium]
MNSISLPVRASLIVSQALIPGAAAGSAVEDGPSGAMVTYDTRYLRVGLTEQ